MRRTWLLGVPILLLLAAACGKGGSSKTTGTTASSAASTTTSATSATSATATTSTTDVPDVTTPTGADDASVKTRLNYAATAELTLFVDSQKFTDDLATLASVDPTLHFAKGVGPPSSPTLVNIALSSDAQWVCLSGKSSIGHVFVLVAGPSIDVYAGTKALTSCTSTTYKGLQRANA